MSEEVVRPGEVYEISDKARQRLAVVVRDEGAQKHFRVVTDDGRETSVSAKQLGVRFADQHLRAELGAEQLGQSLRSLQMHAASLATQADVADLWEVVRDAGSVDLDTAADLLFAGTTGEHRLAALLALRGDQVYFKSRGLEMFDCRSQTAVDELMRARQADQERSRDREQFVLAVVGLLSEPAELRPARLAEHTRDDIRGRCQTRATEGVRASTQAGMRPLAGPNRQEMFRRYLDVLAQYAAAGDGAPAATDADALLDEVEERLKTRLPHAKSRRAFQVLVELSHWGDDENLFLLKSGLPTSFPEAVSARAAELVARVHADSSNGSLFETRRDLTHLLVVAVDDVDTEDKDDALSIEPLPDGWRVGIHVAAAGYYLSFGDELEREARRRGATLYLPDRRVPMLPPELSEGAFSLHAGALRPALSFLVEMDAGFRVRSEQVVRSVVRVAHALSYDAVDDLLEFGEGPVAEAMRALYSVSDALLAARRAAGAVFINVPEQKVWVDPDGVVHVVPLADVMSRLMVSELMILANSIAARVCSRAGLAVGYRCQDPPQTPVESGGVDAMPEGLARAYAMRRRMMPATLSFTPSPHYALGVASYVQATSPIRRYADLLVHLQLESHLQGGSSTLPEAQARQAMQAADQAAGEVGRVGRDSRRYWLLRYLEQVGEGPYEATIVELDDQRGGMATVLLNDTLLQLKVPLRRRLPVGSTVLLVAERVKARSDVLRMRVQDG